MQTYLDSSVLVSLYRSDAHTIAAITWLAGHKKAIVVTPLQVHELKNAIRLAVFRKLLTADVAQAALNRIDEHLKRGDLDLMNPDWPAAYAAAEQIGSKHTMKHGIRAVDLLHLGIAAAGGARQFLSFDTRQKELAHIAGMKVGP